MVTYIQSRKLLKKPGSLAKGTDAGPALRTEAMSDLLGGEGVALEAFFA
jgi:hypothetical protein